MIESELPPSDLLLSQKTIDLAYQIDKFVESEHQFTIDIIKKTLKHVKFVIERYIQKFDKFDESINYQQCIKSRFQTSSLQFFPD